MGTWQDKSQTEEYYYQIAKEILLEIGEISHCTFHSDEMFVYRTENLEESQIYAIATEILKKKYPENKNFTEFHSQIARVLNDAALSRDDCPVCREIRED